jgi:ABC-type ATPase involved in cell division
VQLWAALARAMVNRPTLLLADEPAALLDATGAQALMRLFDEFVRSGVTVLMASHEEAPALPPSARCLRLAAGSLAS